MAVIYKCIPEVKYYKDYVLNYYNICKNNGTVISNGSSR